MLRKIVLLLLLAGTLLSAQRITQIKYEGLAHLSSTAAAEISGVRVGDQMNVSKINQSIKNFFAQGYFKDVWVESKGSVLVYHFVEKAAIANIEIKGYGSGDEGKKLLANSGLKKGDLYDSRDVRKAEAAIIAGLEAQGYYDTVVEVSTSKISESSVSVIFEVNKGEKIKIKKVHFVGADALGESDFSTYIVNKESGVLGWIPLFDDGVAKVNQLEYDAYRVKDVYMQNGYLDAYVSKPLMRVDFGSYNATVDYQIKEGIQYRVGEVSISQDLGLNNEALLDDLSLKSGRVFDIKRMRKDVTNLKEKVGNQGYAYAKVSPRMNKNPEAKTINLNYVIQKGVPVTINDVMISGNDVTKDRVVRRYIYLAPGDKFNATDLKDSKKALGRTGFFEKVDIETQRVSEEKINLLVKVKEAPTGSISAGGGYDSYEGFMINASISDKNLFGSGLSSQLGFDISEVSTNYNLSFTNPRVWDSLYSLGVSLYKKEYEYIDYTQDQLGGSVNIGRQFFRHLYASAGIGYIDNQSKAEDNNESTSTYSGLLYDDQYQKTSLYARVKYDNTDDYYLPREGFIAEANIEFAQMDGDLSSDNLSAGYTEYANFTKLSAKFGAFYGMEDLLDYDLILRYKARYSMIFSEDQYIPVGEKLFMGGIGSVRGYEPYSLSPMIGDDERVGGTTSFTNTIEASIPLSEAANMRLAFFVDYGILTSDSIRTWDGSTAEVVNFGDISRASAGAVVEWQSGFGPINLVFAQAINPEDGDETATFEFSMGTKF
ncbi:MAG: outer membrane protein assembly factor BamA [Sulfurimonas sp.]